MNNFYRFLVTGTVVCSSLIAVAKGDVSGVVINKDSGQPMDFVTVQIFNSKTGKPLNVSAMTDENGAFSIKGLDDGDYIVKIINVGSIDQERNVRVAGSNVSVGTVQLADDAKLL